MIIQNSLNNCLFGTVATSLNMFGTEPSMNYNVIHDRYNSETRKHDLMYTFTYRCGYQRM